MSRTSVYTTLFFEIVGDDHSPYNQMVKKLNDIETGYFEKTLHWAEQPSTELDFQIKADVIKCFDKLADDTLNKELKDRLFSLLQQCPGESRDYEWSMKSIEFIKKEAYDYFGQIEPCPKIDEAFLQRLYSKALCACSEGNGQGNIGYNKGFHHALLHNTIWECKELIERRIIKFIDEDLREYAVKCSNQTN